MNVRAGSIYFRDPEGRLPTNYLSDGDGGLIPWNGAKAEADSGPESLHHGSTQLYNLALSGGGLDTSTTISRRRIGIDRGVESNNSTRQFSGHANVNVAATPKLDIGTSLNFVKLNNHLGADGGVSSMLGAEFGHIGVFTAGAWVLSQSAAGAVHVAVRQHR